MTPPASIERLLAQLERQLAQHREQEKLHSEQEAAHREQRERHAAESTRISQTVEALRSSLNSALGLVSASGSDDKDLDTGHRRILTRLVSRVIEEKLEDERFGGAGVTEEVNQRFPDLLREPVGVRNIALVLRRLAHSGRIRQVRRGRPHHEALYVRGT
jgi:hypothetical protein